MKRFNEFVKRLSLTQQLFALIFFFVTFFAVFFFVYINGNVTTVIREQMYGTLDSTLQSWAMSDSTNDEQRQLINSAAGIDIFMVRVDKTLDGATHVTLAGKNTSDMDLNSSEWKAIAQDILSINARYTAGDKIHHGIVKKVSGDRDSYYSIYKVADDQLLVSKMYSDNMGKLENGDSCRLLLHHYDDVGTDADSPPESDTKLYRTCQAWQGCGPACKPAG